MTCNRAREVVIPISADAEAALCCSIARERRMYSKMQDLKRQMQLPDPSSRAQPA